MGRVLLTGAMVCRVDLAAPPAPAGDNSNDAAVSIAPQPSGDADRSLAAAIRRSVQDEFTDGQVELDFDRASGDFLDLSESQFNFGIRSAGRGDLGLREFKVRLSQNGRVQRTISVFGRVRLKRQVVVADKPLNLGAYIRPDAVRLAPRLFEARENLGITDLQEVIGQRVDRFIAAGEMIQKSDVRPVDLVQRSRPVTVISDGAVAMRLNGTALDSGSFGDTVRVRLGAGRGDRRIVRGTVTAMATVKLNDGAESSAEVASAGIGGGR